MATEPVAAKANTVGMIELYANEFAEALPRHVDGAQWLRQGIAAVRRDPNLLHAANNNPKACLQVLMEAARLGHVPGTKEYYLIPRGNKELGTEPNPRNPRKTRLRQEITGMEGYHGLVERIFRAGAVSSVVVEVVHEADVFRFAPGADDRPVHEVDWFGERGEPIGVYAYAMMRDGGVSKVVVLSKAEVYEFRERSDSYKFNSGPWITDELAMWKKTAARRLEPWVPTSSEYIKDQIRAATEVRVEVERARAARAIAEIPDAEGVVDSEVVEEISNNTSAEEQGDNDAV